MAINSRQSLKDYALRALGYPLIEVDIDETAMDDRIDDALEFFQEYYFDGADRVYHKHQITEEDMVNGYITLPDNIWGVNGIMSFTNNVSTNPNIFDLEYQFRQWDIQYLTSASLVYYTQVMSHLALLDNTLTVQKQFRFNRNSDKLYIDMNWGNKVVVGQWIMVDCYAVLDPEVNTKFWNNREFKEYVVALFKKQWARAYSKYQQIQLPGGVTIDGQSMYQEAVQEIQDIEENIMNNQSPLSFMVG